VTGPDVGLDAVLLDLDGTLIDTVDVWHAAYLQLGTELGVPLSEGFWPHVAGRSMIDSLQVFGEAARVHEPDRLVARLVEAAASRLTEDPREWRWLPGAAELVTHLRAAGPDGSGPEGPGPATGLVTSAWRAFTLPLLDAALGGGSGRSRQPFDAIVCGEDVERGKPSPDPYLRAAMLLDVEPTSCLVIEDSPTGVAAAEAAGMVVLAIPHAGPIEPAPGRAVRRDLQGLTRHDLGALHARLRSGAST
jgi:beta-phosphoglucomutase-like phosphatase (HAD superfamily)